MSLHKKSRTLNPALKLFSMNYWTTNLPTILGKCPGYVQM